MATRAKNRVARTTRKAGAKAMNAGRGRSRRASSLKSMSNGRRRSAARRSPRRSSRNNGPAMDLVTTAGRSIRRAADVAMGAAKTVADRVTT